MVRIRSSLPTFVLTIVTAAVALPFALAARSSPSTSLPITEWSTLIWLTLRSLALPMAAASIALVLAAAIVLFGYGMCPRRGRHALFAFSAVPFLFPPVIVAHAAHQWLGEPHLLLSSSLTVLPAAVFGQAMALRFIDADTLMLTRSLGLPLRVSWRHSIRPMWRRGAALAWMWGAFQLFSDPGIYSVYGGNQAHLASHILRSVAGGSPGPSVVRAAVLMLVPAAIVALIVTRPSFWRGTSLTHLVPRARVSELLSQMKLPFLLRGLAGVLVLPSVLSIAGILITIGWGGASAFLAGTKPSTSILPVVMLIAVAVPVSAVAALLFSSAIMHARGKVRSYGYILVAFMVLASPTATGALLATGLRAPVTVGDYVAIPVVVGGGSAAGGWIGMFLAAVAVCLPMSTLLLLGLASLRTSDSAAAARDLGASPMRVLMTVEFPYLMPIAIASICLETGALFTNLSPLVFVAPSGLDLATPQLLTFVASGQSSAAFALSILTGILTAASILGIGILIAVVLDSTTKLRNRRRV